MTYVTEPIARYLSALGSKVSPNQNRHGWVVAQCPLGPWRHKHGVDKHPSFGVKLEQGQGPAPVHCFSCGFSGDQYDLLLALREHVKQDAATAAAFYAPGEQEAWHARIAQAVQTFALNPNGVFVPGDPTAVTAEIWGSADFVFPESFLEAFERAYFTDEAGTEHLHPYLVGRDVPYRVAEALDLRYDGYRERLCFPVRDPEGQLRGMQGRAIDGSEPRYLHYRYQGEMNRAFWLGENHVDWQRPIVVVEGPFDYARVFELTPQVVCSMGAITSNTGQHKVKLDRLRLARPTLVTLFDDDAAGEKARDTFASVFGRHVLHLLPYGASDPGSMHKGVLKAMLAELPFGLVQMPVI